MMGHRLLLLAVALASASALASTKKKEKKAAAPASSERQELCDSCMKLAGSLTVYVIAAVQKGIDVDQATWLSVVKDGCAGSSVCEATIVKHHGAQIAEELADMVEEIDGDASDSQLTDPRTLPDLLCAPRSVTEACPAKLYKRPDPTPPRETVSTAFWNARSKRTKGGGDVEVHLINDKETMDCGPTEKASLAARFKDPSVRRIKPDEEKLVSVGVVANAQVAPPTLRVKPLGAPCGDGVDVEVDFANPWRVYEVTTNKAFKEESPRSPANLPLLVRLMDDRDARDALPKDHPAAKGEL